MMNRFTLLAVSLFVMFVSGCVQYEVDGILIAKENASLVIRGSVVFDYDGNKCQMAYNAKRNEFRVMDDEMAHYFILRCDADLSDYGQEVTADLTYTTANDVKTEKGLTFKVEKHVPSTGMFWLWCQSRKIGVVVREI